MISREFFNKCREFGLAALIILLCIYMFRELLTIRKMQIDCRVIKITNPASLPKESLPNNRLKLRLPQGDVPNSVLFETLIRDFNKFGDPLINDIFFPLLGNKQFNIVVVITHGIPDPYDAWSANFHGKKSFFFNLSLWSVNDLKSSGLPVIKHEITHVLLSELLHKPQQSRPIDIINHVVINEGIAHFIGYSRNRSRLISENTDKWKSAEKALQQAKVRLADKTISKTETEELLYKANTGKYWDKYAAIAGMFRAASIYERRGDEGLIESIKIGVLPESVDLP